MRRRPFLRRLGTEGRVALNWPLVLLAIGVACGRNGTKVMLSPPFNERTKIGEVTARWEITSEQREFAEGRKLDEPQVRVRYRVDVRNDLGDKMFLRLGEFRVMSETGRELARAGDRIECILAVGDSKGVLAGDLWVTKRASSAVHGFRISHFSLPLSERGRALYREWALQGRKADGAAVDAEIAAYARAAACPRD